MKEKRENNEDDGEQLIIGVFGAALVDDSNVFVQLFITHFSNDPPSPMKLNPTIPHNSC